jgi:DNA primase large subunit
VEDVPLLSDADCIMELFSYPVARMIVAAVESEYLVRRYALSEAKKAFQTLQNEPPEFIEQMAHEFGIHLDNQRIHFTEYLTYAPTWHRMWKLVNRDLRHGQVALDKHDSARLIQEAIREKIQRELLHLFAPAEVKRLFRDDIMMLRGKLVKIEHRTAIREVNENYYPPCIKNIIKAAKSGANIPHVGRFTLVTFLTEIGMETEDILGVFAASPDFNKEKSRYQVEHISGKASSTTYTTPKCDTILTWGLCDPDDLCKTVRHPLSYYRRRSRR